MYKDKLLNYIRDYITNDEKTLQIIENLVNYSNENFHCIHSALYFVSDMLDGVIDFKDLEQFENLEPYEWYIKKHGAL